LYYYSLLVLSFIEKLKKIKPEELWQSSVWMKSLRKIYSSLLYIEVYF